jgi:hypothetical protein
MSRRLASVLAVAAVSALILGTGALTGASLHLSNGRSLPQLGGDMIKTNSTQVTPRFGGTVSSENWSGYVVQPTSAVTAVTTSFVVPAAGDDLPGLASTWTGIGGDPSADLIQAGVAESSFPSLPVLGTQYYAWYELLPASPVALTGCTGDSNCTVTPGDTFNVSITETAVGSNIWNIVVQDVGKWSDTIANIAYTSSNSSGEWVLEAPTLEVAPVIVAGVGTAQFLGKTGTLLGNTYSVDGGAAQSVASGNPTQMDMSIEGLLTEATPSAIASDGETFDVCTYASSCATPPAD